MGEEKETAVEVLVVKIKMTQQQSKISDTA